MTAKADVLILGGGPAGSAAAIHLARAGRHVILLERDRDPKHKVCGEFLSTEALHILSALDVSATALGAVPIHTVRLCSKGTTTESPLPFPAASLTRKRLDAALLEAAACAGADVRRGHTIQALSTTGTLWQATTSTGESFEAPQAILATGKHDLRGHLRPYGSQGDLVAMKMYLRLAPAQSAALSGHVDLLSYPGGYAGLQPIEDGAANLCALIQRSSLNALGGNWDALFAHIRNACPHARERLAGAEPLLDKPLAISPIPYGFTRRRAIADNLRAVGDQAAVIPSFTGDGMSIALFSALRAAQSVLAQKTAQTFQRQLHRDLHFQVARATAISRALVHPLAKPLIFSAVRACPSLLRWTAATTRLPPSVVHDLQLAM